jgi:hypothetical protein
MNITILAAGSRGDVQPAIVRRAAAVGEIITQEGGVGHAVHVIEEHVG